MELRVLNDVLLDILKSVREKVSELDKCTKVVKDTGGHLDTQVGRLLDAEEHLQSKKEELLSTIGTIDKTIENIKGRKVTSEKKETVKEEKVKKEGK